MRMGYVPPGTLDTRAVEGLSEYARSWPGEITVITPHAEQRHPAYDVLRTDDIAGTITQNRFDVVGALHRPEYEYLSALAPTVYTAEFDRRIRNEQLRVGASAVARARISAGQLRLERTYRRMARQSAGLQCNGTAAWTSYGHLSANAIGFADHRIRGADLKAARSRSTWTGGRPLRVAFSGRLTAVKGATTVIEVARRLPQMDFSVLGTGDLADTMQKSAPSNVTFHGFVSFDKWKPFVRKNVDVALLPHPQGDPSCTYFEMLGSGVPIVGLHNATWTDLADRGAGWAEHDVDGLVSRLARLQPTDLDAARREGLQMVTAYEAVAARRVDHLVDVARSSAARAR